MWQLLGKKKQETPQDPPSTEQLLHSKVREAARKTKTRRPNRRPLNIHKCFQQIVFYTLWPRNQPYADGLLSTQCRAKLCRIFWKTFRRLFACLFHFVWWKYWLCKKKIKPKPCSWKAFLQNFLHGLMNVRPIFSLWIYKKYQSN